MRSLFAFVILVLVAGLAAEARAIVGRPLTPVSYAGVARRTVRRSAYVGGAAAVGTAAAVHATPYPGATPYYSGGTVVYVTH